MPAMRFLVEAPAGHLDLGLCVNSGQVFRWHREADGAWFGVDGDYWYRVWAPEGEVQTRDAFRQDERNSSVHTGTDVFRVETNGTADDFNRLFRLDWRADEVAAEIVRRGPEMAPYVNAMHGLRLLRPRSATEVLFTFLCTPNNNIPRITGMVRHLATYGPAMDEADGRPIHRFPNVATVAAIPPAELRARGFGYRANTIPAAAQYLLARGGDAYVESLRDLSYEDAHKALLAVPNIGRKLADCIALFGLDYTCALPVDTHIWQVAQRLYFPQWAGSNLTDLKYRETSAFLRTRFGDLTGWAQQSLFVDNVFNWRIRQSRNQDA